MRRAASQLSMPTIAIPFGGPKASLPLPGSAQKRKPLSSAPSRRLTNLLRSRVARWPLLLLICLGVFFVFGGTGSRSSSDKHREVGRGVGTGDHGGGREVKGSPGYQREEHGSDDSGIFAEDDLAVMHAVEEAPLSAEEIKAANAEAIKKTGLLVIQRREQLRSLINWIMRGGEFPDDVEAPTQDQLDEMTTSTFEEFLSGIPGTADDTFADGWLKDAEDRLHICVFSKTYCGFSRNAKNIMNQYSIIPPPFITELDLRDDMSKLQALLGFLTGRRTVPNIIIDFTSIGGSDEVTTLHHEGGLAKHLNGAELTWPEDPN